MATEDVKIPLENFSLAAAECAICVKALDLGGSVAMAARFMKCSESRVRGIMHEHGLKSPSGPDDDIGVADDSESLADARERVFAGALAGAVAGALRDLN